MAEKLIDIREVASLLYKQDVEITEDSDPIEILKNLQDKAVEVQKKIAEDKYKFGFKEGSLQIEKKLKSNFGVDSTLLGEELISKLSEEYKEALGNKNASSEELSKIKSDYSKKLEEIQQQFKTENEDWKFKYEQQQQVIEQANKNKVFNDAVNVFLQDSNLNFSDSEFDNKLKIEAYKDSIKKYNLDFSGNEVKVLSTDGTPLLDSLNRPVTWEEINKKTLKALVGYKTNTSNSSFKQVSGVETIEAIRKSLSEMKDKTSEDYKEKQKLFIELSKTT